MLRISTIARQTSKPARRQARHYSSEPSKVGFIGLGQMGARMAANLLKKGKSVVGYDINAQALEGLKEHGGTAASSLRDFADCDIVVTMLTSSPHVKAVYLESEDALVKVLKNKALLIDASTIDPGVARAVHTAMADKGHKMVDAPVSGGVLGAESGTLTFMCGAQDAAFDQAKPILELMGKNIVHTGGPGNGQVAKVCNNLALGIEMAGIAEAMNLGIKLGMDAKTLAGIFNTSSARCWSSDTYNPVPGVIDGVPANKDYAGGFASKLMAKDLGLANSAANDSQVPLPLGGQALQVYNLLSSKGYANKDFGSVYDFLSKTE